MNGLEQDRQDGLPEEPLENGWTPRRKLTGLAGLVCLGLLAGMVARQKGWWPRAAEHPDRVPAGEPPSLVRPPSPGLPGAPPLPLSGTGLAVVVAGPSGRGVQEARVDLWLVETGLAHTATTGADGRARLPHAAAGVRYRLRVEALGYEVWESEVAMPPSGALELPVALTPAEEEPEGR